MLRQIFIYNQQKETCTCILYTVYTIDLIYFGCNLVSRFMCTMWSALKSIYLLQIQGLKLLKRNWNLSCTQTGGRMHFTFVFCTSNTYSFLLSMMCNKKRCYLVLRFYDRYFRIGIPFIALSCTVSASPSWKICRMS